MSDAKATTPRVFIARHGMRPTLAIVELKPANHCAGETEWTISGQCTGNAEIPLTENGKKQSQGTGKMLVGPGKLIDPAKLAHVFCSPRNRAVTTLDLLLGEETKSRLEGEKKLTITDDITEWDYGKYEGLTPAQIKDRRKEQGKGKWNIWVEGCEEGE
jgi:probable phosphoglycerate mutase